MKAELKRVWERIKEVIRTPMPDAVSHVAHWILVIAATSAVAAIGQGLGYNGLLWGYIASEIILYVFFGWEGFNYGTHLALKHDMVRWTRDGILDLVGPLLNRFIWIMVYIR